jgi:hypothetical protein
VPITNSNLPPSQLPQGGHHSSTDFAQCSAVTAASYQTCPIEPDFLLSRARTDSGMYFHRRRMSRPVFCVALGTLTSEEPHFSNGKSDILHKPACDWERTRSPLKLCRALGNSIENLPDDLNGTEEDSLTIGPPDLSISSQNPLTFLTYQ